MDATAMLEMVKEKHRLETTDSIDGVHYLKSAELWAQFIEPHRGTHFKFCLRADFPETFDRWGVSLFEESFNPQEFEQALSKLDKFAANKERIVREELEGREELK